MPGRPTTLAYGRARPAVLAAGAGRVDCLSYLPFLMLHVLGGGWILVSAVITQR